jgi:hypothetical protein
MPNAMQLAPLLAFMNNVLEIRVDAVHMCFNAQRPRWQSCQDIGSWFDLGPPQLLRRTTAHPLHTGPTNIFGATISEPAMRPDSRFDVLNVLGFLAVVCNATMVVFVGLQVMMAS